MDKIVLNHKVLAVEEGPKGKIFLFVNRIFGLLINF